jgi:hypothetical protein
MARVFPQRVIALAADNEKPTPRAPSTLTLLYETRTSGVSRPGETAIGIDKATSPDSVTANEAGTVPGTMVFVFNGGDNVTPSRRMQAWNALCFGAGLSGPHVHPGAKTLATTRIAKRKKRTNHRIVCIMGKPSQHHDTRHGERGSTPPHS